MRIWSVAIPVVRVQVIVPVSVPDPLPCDETVIAFGLLLVQFVNWKPETELPSASALTQYRVALVSPETVPVAVIIVDTTVPLEEPCVPVEEDDE